MVYSIYTYRHFSTFFLKLCWFWVTLLVLNGFQWRKRIAGKMNNRIGKWFDILYADNNAVETKRFGGGEKTISLSTMRSQWMTSKNVLVEICFIIEKRNKIKKTTTLKVENLTLACNLDLFTYFLVAVISILLYLSTSFF